MHAQDRHRTSDTWAAWRWWQPRYELRLVYRSAADPVLVWSRHRIRALAAYSLRVERAARSLGEARLVLVDRRTGTELTRGR